MLEFPRMVQSCHGRHYSKSFEKKVNIYIKKSNYTIFPLFQNILPIFTYLDLENNKKIYIKNQSK